MYELCEIFKIGAYISLRKHYSLGNTRCSRGEYQRRHRVDVDRKLVVCRKIRRRANVLALYDVKHLAKRELLQLFACALCLFLVFVRENYRRRSRNSRDVRKLLCGNVLVNGDDNSKSAYGSHIGQAPRVAVLAREDYSLADEPSAEKRRTENSDVAIKLVV